MGEAYPELIKARPHVEKVLAKEEERFAETLDQGMQILEETIAGLQGEELPGDVVFKLYDTYGFPVDLTADVARERGLSIDEEGFELAMTAQRDRGRAASKFGSADSSAIRTEEQSEFSGYERIEGESAVTALFKDGQPVSVLEDGEHGAVILASTPFYAESGGQVGDTGVLDGDHGSFTVGDTQKSGQAILHLGRVQLGKLAVGDRLVARVDGERRGRIVLNHSATHLLHAALKKVLGEHVMQKGSLVAPDRLRFDFSHFEALLPAQLQQVENLVNEQIRRNTRAETNLMAYDDAVASGAIALFGEKYGDEVRVMRLGDFSVELCGGTHVKSAGEIGIFKITSEGGVASGIRRIEAVTGKGALEWIEGNLQALGSVASLLRTQPGQASAKVEQLLKHNRELEKELATLKRQLASGRIGNVTENITEIEGIKVLASRMDGADAKTLREAVDRFKDRLENAVVVLASVDNGKVRLAAGVTRNNLDRIRAGDVIRPVAEQVGGRGGGRPDFAEAGGSNPEALDAALGSVPAWVAEHLSRVARPI
jgi:alanyl-tRNA synthetase